jgi:hypothetical protein
LFSKRTKNNAFDSGEWIIAPDGAGRQDSVVFCPPAKQTPTSSHLKILSKKSFIFSHDFWSTFICKMFEIGAELVMDTLGRIEHGVFA